jgi:hypothetical protein
MTMQKLRVDNAACRERAGQSTIHSSTLQLGLGATSRRGYVEERSSLQGLKAPDETCSDPATASASARITTSTPNCSGGGKSASLHNFDVCIMQPIGGPDSSTHVTGISGKFAPI